MRKKIIMCSYFLLKSYINTNKLNIISYYILLIKCFKKSRYDIKMQLILVTQVFFLINCLNYNTFTIM